MGEKELKKEIKKDLKWYEKLYVSIFWKTTLKIYNKGRINATNCFLKKQ